MNPCGLIIACLVLAGWRVALAVPVQGTVTEDIASQRYCNALLFFVAMIFGFFTLVHFSKTEMDKTHFK